MRLRAIVSGLLGVALLVISALGLISAREGSDVRVAEASGIPVRLYSSGDGRAHPTVVVAHGFAASQQMMEPLALGLQRAGFTVVTFDFPGHGSNPEPLSVSGDVREMTWDAVARPLAEVVDWASVQPEVDRSRLALLGHSMGAGAAVTYALDDARGDARLRGTVSLSLPSDEGLDARRPAVPRDLLLLYGGMEAAQFSDTALAVVQDAYPDAYSEVTYGSVADGTARRAQAIPGVEHISILFSPGTLEASVAWLADALGTTPADASLPPLLLYAALALIGGGLLLVPAGLLLLGSTPRGTWAEEPPPIRGPMVLLTSAVASILGALGAWALTPLADQAPLAVGGYLAAWFACAGLAAVLWWLVRYRSRERAPGLTVRSAIAGIVLAAIATAVVAVPGSLSWAEFSLVGARPWIAALLLAAFCLWFGGDELLVRRTSVRRRLALMVATRLIATGVLLAAIPLLGAPGFLILTLPLLVLFLIVLGVYATAVAGRRNSYVAAVLVQAVPAAALVASTFPLVS